MGRKIWPSKNFWVIVTAVVLGLLGGIALSQTPGCQVGVYDCVGQLFLYNGNVGVGTSAPGAKLDVGVGASQCCATQTPNISLAQASNTNGQMAWLQFHNAGEAESYIRLAGGGNGARAGQRRLEIGDSQGVLTGLTVTGNVGIGTTAPTEKLQVAGNLAISGAMTSGAVPLARMAYITTLTFTAVANNSFSMQDITHGLGTDAVMILILAAQTSGAYGNFSVVAERSDHMKVWAVLPTSQDVETIGATPGNVRVKVTNRTGATNSFIVRVAVVRE